MPRRGIRGPVNEDEGAVRGVRFDVLRSVPSEVERVMSIPLASVMVISPLKPEGRVRGVMSGPEVAAMESSAGVADVVSMND